MDILRAKHLGFCYGVKRSISLAGDDYGDRRVYTYGKLIHNSRIVGSLENKGIHAVGDVGEAEPGSVLVIRSHGAPVEEIERARGLGLEVVDATCPFVKRTRGIVADMHAKGYAIAIFGKKDHPEVVGINSVCGYTATVINDENEIPDSLLRTEKLCLVAQTTASAKKFANIADKFAKEGLKTVEIFDTICYTTQERQREAEELSRVCDKVLIIGDAESSNTLKLKEICAKHCTAFLIGSAEDLTAIKFNADDKIGIVAGASAPEESITEVIRYMDNNFTVATNEEFLQAVDADETSGKLSSGKIMKVKVISADEKGITVAFNSKVDGFISAEEATLDGTYDPADYPADTELEVKLLASRTEDGVYRFSKKAVDEIKEGDKVVDTIRDGQEFELKIDRAVERDVAKKKGGGLLGKLGTYTVFIPASQIKERYVSDLKPYVGKTLRLERLEINDEKKRIVASQKVIIERERKEREEIFWANVVPGVIVNGKVKSISKFGAFVSVDGYDCLVHISDISWVKFKSIEDILKVGKKYDFVVLKADREKGKVSLGYKQLQKHPFDVAIENHPVGSTFTGKITSIMPFGAFVEVEPGVEGLVHVSEASNTYVKNINDIYKVGDEVEVKVLAVDSEAKKITLSAKACMPELAPEERAPRGEKKESKPRAPRKRDAEKESGEAEWSEDAGNNPFADLLKDLEVKK